MAEKRVVVAQQHHSGPLPSPDTLARYEQLMPGLADRIVQMAEREQEHAITAQQKALESDIRAREATLRLQNRGQSFALTVVFVSLGVAVVLALMGHDGPAAAIGGVMLGGVAAAFLGARFISPAGKKTE